VLRHVLVPLDGSVLAEAAIPAAEATAKAFDARVTLFHVLEEWAPERVHGQRHLTDAAQARAYLESVAQRPVFGDREVEIHVHEARTGNVADSIMAHADELGADLVVLCTHGEGGLKGFFFGRIALRALGRGRTPILLVTPPATGEPPPFVCRTILVPLDGTAGHEPALPTASLLARAWAATVHLVIVVPTAGTLSGPEAATGVLMPSATRVALDLAQGGAEEYVERLAQALRAEGLSASSHVGRGEPAACLADAASTVGADLLVVASHAKGAMDAFWSGSLTPKLMEKLSRPILLVRAAPE
jgi:nucleotide-binding universal stress UspA family protein